MIDQVVNRLAARDYYCDTGGVIFGTIGENVINFRGLMMELAMVGLLFSRR
jgi:hypothetical protein